MKRWVSYNLFYKPLSVAFYRSRYWRIIPELKKTERQSADHIRERTEVLLKGLLARAYAHAPFFHHRMLEAGYVPGGRFDQDIFYRIPPMTKQDIRASMAEMAARNVRVSNRSTSGTTGEPLIFVKDHTALMYMDAAMHQVYSWHGIYPGDPESRFWGSAIPSSDKIKQQVKDRLLNRRRLSSFHMGEKECHDFWSILLRFRPKYFYGYPNAICHFAEFLKANGWPGERLGIKVIICTGEILFPHQRVLLEEVFRCRVANEYGSTENGILAFQCPEGKLHVMAQNVLLEIVDEHGIPKKIGEMGKILVTEYHSNNIPFIRYSVGDLGSFTGEECTCGRSYPIMEINKGRIDNFIVTKSGNKVYDAILAYIFKRDFIKFRGYQRQAGKLKIEYIPKNRFNCENIKVHINQLKKYLGEDMEIEFVEVKEIHPLLSGKLQYFVSEIK